MNQICRPILLLFLIAGCQGGIRTPSKNISDSKTEPGVEAVTNTGSDSETDSNRSPDMGSTDKASSTNVIKNDNATETIPEPKFESISYSVNNIVVDDIVFTALAEMSAYATVVGPAKKSFKVFPALPEGLSLDEKSGTISGIPAHPSPMKTYKLTVENEASNVSTNLQITVIDTLPSTFTFPQQVWNLKLKYLAPQITPTTVGTHQTGSYTIAPDLPSGLIINAETGVISGRPVVNMELTDFTVTFSNSGGEKQAPLQIAISDEYLDLSTLSTSRDVNGVPTPMNLAFSAGFGGLTVVGDYLYMFGGAHNFKPWQTFTNRIQRAPLSDPTNWTNTGGLLPNRTAWVPAVTIDDKIYIYGNIYGADKKSIFSAEVAAPDIWSDTGYDLPDDSANHLIYVGSDNVYILAANKIYIAPRSNPAAMVDSGAANLPYFTHKNYFEFEGYLYVPDHSGGFVRRASKANPLVWETVCSNSTLSGGDNYTLTLIGSTVYYLGGHDYTGTWSAPVDDLCNWTQSAFSIPQNSWGNSQSMRIGDFFYIFGGLNASYVGHEKITRAAIKVRYD